jgi:hypothetical protein
MADTQTAVPETPDPLGSTIAKYPFLKAQKTAGEKAVEAKVGAETAKAEAEFGEKRKALEDISAKDKAKYEEVKSQMKEIPEFKPTQENAFDIGAVFSMIATMGVALGGSGKLSGLNAMNAMGGMLKGYQQGRKDLFAKEQAIFDKELQSLKAHNDALLKDLEVYQKLSATDKEAAMAKAAEISAKNPGVIKSLIESGRADVALDIAKANTKLQSDIIEKSISAKLTGKVQQGALAGIQGVRSINNLERQLDDPEVQIGLRAKVAPFFEKLTSSANSKKDFETAVNETLTGTDKTTLFLKDALLETYAIERAAKGGQRLTVQDMKMVGPVLDPTNYKPETYRALLESRRRSLYNNLQDQGFTVAEINQKAAEHPYEPYSSGKSSATQTSKPRKVSSAELSEYAKQHKMTEEDAKTFLTSQGFSFD